MRFSGEIIAFKSSQQCLKKELKWKSWKLNANSSGWKVLLGISRKINGINPRAGKGAKKAEAEQKQATTRIRTGQMQCNTYPYRYCLVEYPKQLGCNWRVLKCTCPSFQMLDRRPKGWVMGWIKEGSNNLCTRCIHPTEENKEQEYENDGSFDIGFQKHGRYENAKNRPNNQCKLRSSPPSQLSNKGGR